MDKAEALKYIETKGDSKFVIRTEEEENTFLTNHAKEVEEKTIGPKISELHSRYDSDVLAITGLKKEPTEKSYEFVKRVLTSFKTDAEKAKTLEGEITSLKEQIKNNSGDTQLKADLASVQQQYQALKLEKETEVTKLKTEHEVYKAESLIRAALPVNIKKGLPEDAVKALQEQAIAHLLTMAQFKDGKLVFIENGVVKRNQHNALLEYTPAELLQESLKNIIDTGRKIENGPNVNGEITKEFDKTTGKLTKIAMVIPDAVKTKEDVSKYLIGAGLLRGTEEYTLAYKEYSANLPMR